MSKEALAKVVQRAISDAGFRRQLSSDPAGALRGFDLTADEMSAVRTGDAGRLSTLGIDQRMSKAFSLGGAAAATRITPSDLTPGGTALIDDGTSASGTIIPRDPDLAANAQSARVGDDWKYADRVAAQGNAATIEGSPEATAAELSRIDDASATRASAINDDPDGFLAAADARGSGGDDAAKWASNDPDNFLESADYRAAGAATDASGGSTGETTAFVDESEGYLTSVGYDPNASTTAVTDAHDRGDATSHATWGGDERSGPSRIADDDAAGGSGPSEGGPNVDH